MKIAFSQYFGLKNLNWSVCSSICLNLGGDFDTLVSRKKQAMGTEWLLAKILVIFQPTLSSAVKLSSCQSSYQAGKKQTDHQAVKKEEYENPLLARLSSWFQTSVVRRSVLNIVKEKPAHKCFASHVTILLGLKQNNSQTMSHEISNRLKHVLSCTLKSRQYTSCAIFL